MESTLKIKCLIVDDEPIARKIISNYIAQIDQLENAGECKNASQVIDKISKDDTIKILFLDINMPNMNGLTLAKIMKNQLQIIFTTAYSQYAVESYEVSAVDYLLKPFQFDRFAIAVFKAIDRITNTTLLNQTKSKPIFIKSEGKNYPVLINEILYCEAMKNYTKIVLSNGQELKPLITLSKIESDLSQECDSFVRVHRSFLIMKTHITAIKIKSVLINTIEIPIGIQYRDSFLVTMGLK